MPNNPYIEKVADHPKILNSIQDIYSHRGKWDKYFKNNNPLVLEIGTGLGNFFSSQVIDNPDNNYLGMEIRYKRLYKTAEKALGSIKNNDNTQNGNQEKLSPQPYHSKVEGVEQKVNTIKRDNFVVLKDFGENIVKIFEKQELNITYIFFPDPWDKSDKTRKKRLVQFSFLDDLYNITKLGGKLIFKTDHRGYFDFVLEEIKKTLWNIDFKTYDYEKEGLYDKNKITEFEQIFRGQKLKVNYLELSKK